jgi:hypothetical protein
VPSSQTFTFVRVPPLAFEQRTRLKWVNNSYFLDGAPASLALFGAPVALEFPITQMRDLLYKEVVDERAQTIAKLEDMPPASSKRAQLASSLDRLADLSPTIPLPVRLFVSRARSMCHGLRNSKSPTFFSQCQNDTCCRLFYKGERPNTKFGYPMSCVNKEDAAYWHACAPTPLYDSNFKRFCSAACGHQWTKHWHQLMPDSKLVYNTDSTNCNKQRGQCSKAFHMAIKRNSKAAHEIAKCRKRHLRHFRAISPVDANREFGARLDMLNVDTGLLYAAQLAAKLPRLAKKLTLPGAVIQWRNGGEELHRNALIRVARIYAQHQTTEPISDLLNRSAFLSAIRNQVTSIF